MGDIVPAGTAGAVVSMEAKFKNLKTKKGPEPGAEWDLSS
jgi:hypothetical protein